VCHTCLEKPRPFLAEHFCLDCQTPFTNAYPLDENGRCGPCRLGLTHYDAAYSFGEFTDALRRLIHLFKYDQMEPLAEPLGRLMVRAAPRQLKFDMVVPMPLHWMRQWSRGFNQSELLGRVVARRLNTPMRDALRRKRATPQQAGLTNSQRRKNVEGAFELRRGASVKDLHVLLVDDVLTTGATLGACAKVLKRAGAKRVSVLTLARVDRRPVSVVRGEPPN
jgi:ComF family protein